MIELQGVHRRYAMSGQTVHALAGVDLHIGPGEFVALTGPSGSGKSSLLNILGCLDHPSEGRYLIEGSDVARLDDEASSDLRNRRIGFVFQSFHLLPRLTVLENVLLPLRFHRSPPADAKDRAAQLLERVGLADRRNHRPSELSGGQMQRVAIARALLLQPALLLADEPTGNLDSKTGQDLMKLLRDLNERGKTIVIITHDVHIASQAKRTLRIVDGHIFDEGGAPDAVV